MTELPPYVEARFSTIFPSAGPYRLAPNLQAPGAVRTAEFAIDVQGGAG